MVALLAVLPSTVIAKAPASPELVQKGSQPRRALRLDLTTPSSQTIDLTMSTEMNGAMPGMAVPPIRMGMRFDVEERVGDLVRYGFELVDVGVAESSPLSGALESQLQTMVGLTGSAFIDAVGENSDIDIQIPDGMPAEMRSSMEKSLDITSVLLPRQPVGVGAIWKQEQDLEQDGIKIHQISTWTLVSQQDSQVTLGVTVSQTAEPQLLKTPDMPPGAQVKLSSMQSTGTGQTVVDLTKIAPVSSEVSLDIAMSMVSQVGEMAIPMDMGFTFEIALAQR